MKFQDLGLTAPLLRAVSEKGYETPTPIQEQAIPPVLRGRDLLGCAQTGTGKTAAFTLPILQLLAEEPPVRGRRPIRALVLTPTRELAIQIDECCRDYARYTPIRHCVIFGGVNQRPQVEALQQGVDLLVATPGRLLDLIGQGYISLDTLRFFVLDEADRMLDMGFIHDIRRILPLLPAKRQTLFFSATMPADIAALAARILHDPVEVTVTPPASVVETIAQRVHFAAKSEKSALLIDLLHGSDAGQVLVFTRTKHGADRLAKILNRAGIGAAAIHGNKSQNARVRAMNDFKSGACRVLIATDIAARGIDIDQLPLVINYDLPEVAETYVHRIGRTGRAGHEGAAWSFCSEEELEYLLEIQKLTGQILPVEGEVPDYAAGALADFARRNERKGGRSGKESRSGGKASKTAPKRETSTETPSARPEPADSGAAQPKSTRTAPAASETARPKSSRRGPAAATTAHPEPVQTKPASEAAQPEETQSEPARQKTAASRPTAAGTARPAAAGTAQPADDARQASPNPETPAPKRNRHRRRGNSAGRRPDAAPAAPITSAPATPAPTAATPHAGTDRRNRPQPTSGAASRKAEATVPKREAAPRKAERPKPENPKRTDAAQRATPDRNAVKTATRQGTPTKGSERPHDSSDRPAGHRNRRRGQAAGKPSPGPARQQTGPARPDARKENRISRTNDWKNRVKSLLLRTFGK